MESTINERIAEFLKANSITIRALAVLLNVNEKTLGHRLGGRSKLDLETVLMILSEYSDLSADWLLLGRGPMLRTARASNNVNGDISGDNIQGEHVSVQKADQQIVQYLQERLEEEKALNREYWNTIQKLINTNI